MPQDQQVVERKAQVSACVIARDEELNLPGCLESALPVCEEVVVVDTGSRDATPRIAADMGARVLSFQWIDDFSAARNFAAAQARQPFILRLDADERLVDHSLDALLTYAENQPIAAGRATLVNLLADGERTVETLTCLYPNTPDYRYERRIHEQLRFRGGAPTVVQTRLTILHTGYAPEVIRQRGKGERNLRLLERELSLAPTDPYLHYQLGKTRFALEDYARAVHNFETALHFLDIRRLPEAPYAPTIFVQQAYSFINLRDLPSVLRTIAAGLELFPEYTDLYFTRGVARMQLGDETQIGAMLGDFERCLALGEADPNRYSTVAGVGSYRALHNLGAFFEALGDVENAVQYYRRAADLGFDPSIARLSALRRA